MKKIKAFQQFNHWTSYLVCWKGNQRSKNFLAWERLGQFVGYQLHVLYIISESFNEAIDGFERDENVIAKFLTGIIFKNLSCVEKRLGKMIVNMESTCMPMNVQCEL